MGDEIEIYILKKLDDAIVESRKTSEFHFAAKLCLPNLHKEFSELKELIEKKRAKINSAAAAAAAAPSNVKKIPDASKPPASASAAGASKDSNVKTPEATAALPGVGDKKESDDKKETGEADGPSDDDDAADTEEADAHSDDDNEEPTAPSDDDDVDEGKEESEAPEIVESDTTTSAKTTSPDDSQQNKKEPNVGTTEKTTSDDVPEICAATDKSSTPPADAHKDSVASKTPAFAKSEIAAPDHKPKTPLTAPAADTVVTKPVNEEDLLREQLYYINNLLTEWQMITQKPFSYPSIKEFSNTLKKIKQDLKAEPPTKRDGSSRAGSGTAPTGVLIHTPSPARTAPQLEEFRWSTRVNLKTVYGFEDKILSLERLLVLRRKDTDTFKAFGIHGMAGVGKTTLCQSIFSRPKVTEYFFPRIWVCLSKQRGEDGDTKKEVVKRMLRCLGIDDKIISKVDEKQSIRGLLFALRLQLTGKRYLIVLDDAHNPDEWFKMPDSDAEDDNNNNKIYEKFSYGLPKECGGTVLVTSRVEQVVKNMVGEEENLRCIEPLTDQETCWNIFKDTVKEGDTPFPPDLEKLKAEIVKRCDGLPLAATLLGQIKHKELVENPTAATNHAAGAQSGNHQAAGEAAK